jgi:hypothetical protein
MVADFAIINLETGLPSVTEARQRLLARLNDLDVTKTSGVVIIHGYGSSGQGGKLGPEMRKTLARLRNQGKFKFVIWGENFSMFDETTQKAIEYLPSLTRSPYFAKGNFGITVVIL